MNPEGGRGGGGGGGGGGSDIAKKGASSDHRASLESGSVMRNKEAREAGVWDGR